MPDSKTWARLVACGALCALAGCVQPGSLEDKEEFQRLLGLDGEGDPDGGGLGGASGGGGGGRGGSSGGSAGNGAGGGGSSAQTGCPEACEIIATRCATAGCHSAMMPAGGLNLAGDDFVTRISGQMATTAMCSGQTLIDEGSPEESLIYTKLLDPPACGIRMPLGLALEADDIDCIRRWIADPECGAGAPTAGAGGAGGAGGAAGSGSEPDAGMEPEPNAGSVWIEAESAGTISDPMAVASDGAASGGEFIAVPMSTMLMARPDPADATDGIASYIFNVGAEGTYKIWGRVRIPTTENDSFWVRVDDGIWYQWNNIAMGTDWHWDDVHDSANMDATVEFELTGGQHTLSISYREVAADLDKILITNDLDLMPTGEGQ